MPRSATDRGFGFRAEGLVRILLKADLSEVLRALEQIGIEPSDVDLSLVERIRELFLAVAGPLLLTLELVDELIDLLFNAEFEAERGESVARAASLDLELLAGDIDRMIASIRPGDIHQDERDALVRGRPRLEEIIDLLDATAKALGGVPGEATTIEQRIKDERRVLDETRKELGEELDKVVKEAEGRTTATI